RQGLELCQECEREAIRCRVLLALDYRPPFGRSRVLWVAPGGKAAAPRPSAGSLESWGKETSEWSRAAERGAARRDGHGVAALPASALPFPVAGCPCNPPLWPHHVGKPPCTPRIPPLHPSHCIAPCLAGVRTRAEGLPRGTMLSAPAPGLLPLLLGLLLLCRGAAGQYSSDLCNWKGSGLTHESHKKDVEQVYLRCSEGSIKWMYPTGALIVNLRPNTLSASYKHLTVCIKPFKDSAGANIYLEKTGELKLLVQDGDYSPNKVYCFGYDQGGLFIEATPQQDISRKITGFQYELINKGTASDLHTVSAPCRPCSDTEVLLAVCTSDFVVRGSIQDVTNEAEQQESVIDISANKLYRQKSKVFQPTEENGSWQGQIKTPLECGVRPGDGDFLFTGRMQFGEARLGCAPRFKDFQRMYKEAKDKGLNPCEIGPD
ncbi:meteorin like, glial cell differentiation regulator, partial [Chelydra serpentina]